MLLTREQLAESLDVPPGLLDLWRAQGCPVATSSGPASFTRTRWWRITRRELAEFLGLHPDTITHAAWLRPAIIVQGGRGREQLFDLRLVVRAQFAKRGLMEAITREGQAMRAALREILAVASADPPAGRAADVGTPRRGGPR